MLLTISLSSPVYLECHWMAYFCADVPFRTYSLSLSLSYLELHSPTHCAADIVVCLVIGCSRRPSRVTWITGWCWSSFRKPTATYQLTLQDQGCRAHASRSVPVYCPAVTGTHCAYVRRCLTLSNPVHWQNWMAAYLGYTLRMKTLFCGWPVMVNDTHTRRSDVVSGHTHDCEQRVPSTALHLQHWLTTSAVRWRSARFTVIWCRVKQEAVILVHILYLEPECLPRGESGEDLNAATESAMQTSY